LKSSVEVGLELIAGHDAMGASLNLCARLGAKEVCAPARFQSLTTLDMWPFSITMPGGTACGSAPMCVQSGIQGMLLFLTSSKVIDMGHI
jgi:hypothetical protein